MFIAHHVYPYNGMLRYNNNNDENKHNIYNPTWNSSNQTSYEVDVTQFIGIETTHYEVRLTVFNCIPMTEDEIVKLACTNIIRDTDNKYIEVTAYSNSNKSPYHHFDKRIYRCCASREIDNHNICVCGHLPSISVEVCPREGSPRNQEETQSINTGWVQY